MTGASANTPTFVGGFVIAAQSSSAVTVVADLSS